MKRIYFDIELHGRLKMQLNIHHAKEEYGCKLIPDIFERKFFGQNEFHFS